LVAVDGSVLMSATLSISQVSGSYSLCRLPAASAIPQWAMASQFYTVTKTANETSVICESSLVPDGVQQQGGWALLQIDAVLDLSLTGITAQFSAALAGAGVNLCVVATFDTDYILVPEEKLAVACGALQRAGFHIN
jgi:uncharacterized protein